MSPPSSLAPHIVLNAPGIGGPFDWVLRLQFYVYFPGSRSHKHNGTYFHYSTALMYGPTFDTQADSDQKVTIILGSP